MNQIEAFLGMLNSNPYFAIPLLAWSMAWKGLALWKAGKKSDKIWFVALLVINTLGILEILYYFFFSKMKKGKENLEKKK